MSDKKNFCTSCGNQLDSGDVCDKCLERYGSPDDSPEGFL